MSTTARPARCIPIRGGILTSALGSFAAQITAKCSGLAPLVEAVGGIATARVTDIGARPFDRLHYPGGTWDHGESLSAPTDTGGCFGLDEAGKMILAHLAEKAAGHTSLARL